jgi:apolipoprotein D and lipocalin family protein
MYSKSSKLNFKVFTAGLTGILALLIFTPELSSAQLTTVPSVDLGRYAKTWYNIARNPLFFEMGCVCSRQQLTANSNGVIGVYNSCNDKVVKGPLREIRGTAVSVDPKSNAKLVVDFGLPQKGDYWIIAIDINYRYAVVSDPSLRSLYILSEAPTLSQDLYGEAVLEAGKQVDTSKLLLTEQSGCTYP